jgi:predicted Zn-dependent protease
MVQGQLNFSRDMEREADRIGWGVYQDAGFAPAGVAAMFERMEQAYRLVDNGAFPYLRTHPLTTERIGEARARVEAMGARAAPRSSLLHALMQARARVLQEPAVQALRRAQAQEGAPYAGAERLAALYGSAIASLELREPQRAQAALAAALPLARSLAGADERVQLTLALAQAQTLQAAGQGAQALDLLRATRAPGGGEASSRPLMLARAQAALDAVRAGAEASALRPSTEALQTWLAEHKGDAAAWLLLAQSARAQGFALRALRAEAEAQAAGGDLGGAIDRLRAAQRQSRGPAGSPEFIEASVIDARLRQLMAQRRAQLAELRGSQRGPQDPDKQP